MAVHIVQQARQTDPLVVVCEGCNGIMTVVGRSESPHCARCGTPLCEARRGLVARKASN